MASMNRAERVRRADPRKHFLTHLAVMPGWHKMVLAIGMILAIAGAGGQMMARAGTDAHLQLTSDSGSGAKSKGHAATELTPVASVSGMATPATLLGLSVLIGFPAGWFFRRFLMPAALLALVAFGAFWALSHYGVIHPATWDAAAAATSKGGKSTDGAGTAAAASALSHYAALLKDLAVAHLPSAGGGAFAACLGFRRW